MQDTLYNRIRDGKELTEQEQDSLMDLIGKGCRSRRLAGLRFALRCVPDIKNYGIYERIFINEYGDKSSYCAGQSYPDEMRTVRELLAP